VANDIQIHIMLFLGKVSYKSCQVSITISGTQGRDRRRWWL